MAKLETVPIWWYEAISLIMIAMSLGVILGYPTHLSWWAFFVSLVIAAVLVRTDRNHPGCHEYPNRAKCGYMQPGRPMAIMLFKSYGYITLLQGLYFCESGSTNRCYTSYDSKSVQLNCRSRLLEGNSMRRLIALTVECVVYGGSWHPSGFNPHQI